MLIEKKIKSRQCVPIKNKYIVNKNYEPDDFHIVIYYVKDNTCDIIIRRMDTENGWDVNLTIKIYSIDNLSSCELVIGPSCTNNIVMQTAVNIRLEPIDFNYSQIIPKVIVQTDESADLSPLKYNSVMSFIELNPEYEYVFYDKRDRRSFIDNNFSPEVLEAYDTFVPGAYRADLFRYCYLYLNGGCYFDCKMILKKPLREWINKDDLLVLINDAIPNAFANGIMMMTKYDTRLLECISKIIKNVQEKTYSVDNLTISGPGLLYSRFKMYKSRFYFRKINNDWCNNYRNSIIINNIGMLMCYVYYAGYYQNQNYKNVNHYSVLYKKKMVYYINKRVCDKYIIYVFPHPWNDTFDFEIKNNQIIVKRTDKDERWGQMLIIKIIDTESNNEQIIDIGNSKCGQKTVEIKWS
ncbi:glycosyltransferase [Klosneuvirus KNV1]|uniref:Glycosyltransferase n=1 Tax=Klosneuvirus KNV1 TaxID=1977640 RepID=A0A1V0SK20_9VIRU|nr:glycosyltransferase [Klosneuvirus KNV1]